jgi:hypothetical protein
VQQLLGKDSKECDGNWHRESSDFWNPKFVDSRWKEGGSGVYNLCDSGVGPLRKMTKKESGSVEKLSRL